MEKIKKTDSLRKIFIKISYQKSPFQDIFGFFISFVIFFKVQMKNSETEIFMQIQISG